MTITHKAFGFLIVLVILGLTTGCWDRQEMDDLALVMATGLDLADDGQLEISLQIALPTGIPSAVTSGSSGKKSHLVISAKGKSTSDIMGKLQQQLSRSLYFGHRGVIIIGEQYARHGINQALDSLIRSPEHRFNSYVITASGSTAQDILNTPYQLELIPGIGITKIQAGKWSYPVKIDEFLDAISSRGREPTTAAIRIVTNKDGKKTFLIDQLAVYRGNKLLEYLIPNEMKLLRWWMGHIYQMSYTVQLEPENERYKGTAGVDLLHKTVSIHTKIKNGRPEVGIKLAATVRAVDNDTDLDLSKSPNMKRLETLVSQQIHKDAKSLLAHTQELGADILGIGEEIHIQHPYAWKKIKNTWIDIYPTVPINVEVDIKVTRTGKTQQPVYIHSTD
ncbi:Ger(x)C family spore germination protein [Paenibacillus sp. HN-1]|uniref:Ger(x)C family spore germination protein n=1 Tax=Paenibacillus TaxID=44249 RepID=UPI001CA7F56E|nr:MULTISPECIES: Ger(x)C family spore germination protein [Paenibacillus]MBY9079174.1 Ger(x)C family spore germination protein [Paenibacillus sp. CGMCC 1.18879]MBY9087337.1 Ger(x)C family spore germination protein [Paenibacillus sinensis]